MLIRPRNDRPAATAFRSDLLAGKVVGVAGGAGRIGSFIVRTALELGARVAVIDRDRERMNAQAAELRRFRSRVLMIPGDSSSRATLRRATRSMLTQWKRIDGWVDCVFWSVRGRVDELPASAIRKAMTVNVESVWHAAALVAPIMAKQGGGSIVTVSSVLAHRPAREVTVYAAAKGAVEALTRALAVELADRFIRVNTVVPGGVESARRSLLDETALGRPMSEEEVELSLKMAEQTGLQFQPLPRIGRPEDVAEAVIFLLSDAGRQITGVCLPVDGGHLVDGRHLDDQSTAQWLATIWPMLDRLGFPYFSARTRVLRPGAKVAGPTRTRRKRARSKA